MSSTTTSQKKSRALTISERLLKLQSCIATIRLACLYKMDDDQDFFHLSEVAESVENQLSDLAEQMETMKI